MNVIKLHLFIIHSVIILFLSFFAVENSTAGEASENFVKQLVEKFDSLVNYSAVITTSSGEDKNTINYFFQKPGFVKMVFIEPHEGVSLTYSPVIEKVLIQPFKNFKSMSLSVSPDNSLITSPQGHTIDNSHIGHLLEVVKMLSENGEVTVLSVVNDNSFNKINLEIKGLESFSINKINRYNIKFDTELYFPTEVTAYSSGGEIIEHMKLVELKIDNDFPTGIFNF